MFIAINKMQLRRQFYFTGEALPNSERYPRLHKIDNCETAAMQKRTNLASSKMKISGLENISYLNLSIFLASKRPSIPFSYSENKGCNFEKSFNAISISQTLSCFSP